MIYKKRALLTLFIFLFTSTSFAQYQSTDYTSWSVVAGKDLGTVSIQAGNITLQSDSDLFYIYNKEKNLQDVSLTYKVKHRNEDSRTGVLLRYVSPTDWVYVGCDETSDIVGYSVWYVETPSFKKEIAREIAKLYKGFTRTIRIDCVGQTIQVRIDGEISSYTHIPELGTKAGRIGFRAHHGGNAVISDVSYQKLKAPKPHTSGLKMHWMDRILFIQSGELKVTLATNFPAPYKYQWKNNKEVFAGNNDGEYINLNGDLYPAKGKRVLTESDKIIYSLDVPAVKVNLEVECSVKDHIFETRITRITENGKFKVQTIGFPRQYAASLPNTAEEGALSLAVNEGSDQYYLLRDKGHDSIDCKAAIVILNNKDLAIALDNNSAYETKQFIYRCDKTKDITSIGNSEWIYRGIDGQILELPFYKVIFAGDRNDDGRVNWQDGAVALSEVYPNPYGVERVKNSNVTITMDFASEAQFPFLRQLDNIKKVYYLTDGFRQMLELKGYQAEGHDTGHPDYAGHYNTRAGGLKDLQTLVNEGKKYNAFIGLHINESEAHPAANAYNKEIVSEIPAWKWLDQAYLINKEADWLTGSFKQRLDNLHQELPGLDFIYIDTYREHRSMAYNTAKLFNERGWAVWTEDPSVFNRYGVWIHYYPESKSLISRFVHGTRKDAFANDSLFGGGYDRGASIGFQGWQNGKDMYLAVRNFYIHQLPYRYRMQSPVVYADANSLRYANGTSVRRENGVSSMYDKGRLIQKGNIVFIPWSEQTKEKIYHYNPDGGSTEWELPASWKGNTSVYCYALTDTGRTKAILLPVSNNRITINAAKDCPYVIYPKEAPELLAADWSHGSPVKDMGFDSQSFDYWTVAGNPGSAAITKTPYGQAELLLSGREETGVSQILKGLEGGKTYSAYTWVEIKGKRKATLEVSDFGKETVSSSIEETLFKNTQINSDKRGGYYQLLKVQFTLPAGKTEAKLSLLADATDSDTATVTFDDLRVLPSVITAKEGCVYYEDFENVDFGWGGWMLARPSEAKTHLSERHDPYTDDVIEGNWSLKILDQGRGEIIRTMPSLIQLAPNTTYTIRFQHIAPTTEAFVLKAFSAKAKRELMSKAIIGNGSLEASFTTDDSRDCYISIFQTNKGMLVIDNLGIQK